MVFRGKYKSFNIEVGEAVLAVLGRFQASLVLIWSYP